jgi:thiamine transport system substrate-binding protein
MNKILTLLLATLVLTAACGGDDAAGPTEVTVMTHSSFAVPDEVVAAFEADSGITLRFLDAGDAGQMVNQAILTRDNPVADVLYGIDNTFLSRALEAGLFVPYRPARIDEVHPGLDLDPEGRVTPIDFGDVCLNYDVAALEAAGLAPPATLTDLTLPAYRDLLVVEDPATSSPGLAFLLATIAEFPEGADYDWQRFWADLRANGVEVTAGWEEAYYGRFSAASDGDRPIVVSYASSPPAEVIFADPPVTEAPTAVVTDGCFRQIEFAGILAGTNAGEAAREVVDWMLSDAFQQGLPLNMFVFPAVTSTPLPPEFVEYTTVPDSPARIEPALIEERREEWIDTWTEIVLR